MGWAGELGGHDDQLCQKDEWISLGRFSSVVCV